MKWMNMAVTILMILLFVIMAYIKISNTSDLLPLVAENGEIEISEKSPNNVYLLEGEWGVFDQQSDISSIAQTTPDQYIDISKFADNHILSGSRIYKLHVKTDFPRNTSIAFKLTASYACDLYINSQLILNNNQKQLFFFNTQGKEFNIIVVMSEDVVSAGSQVFRFYMGNPNEMLMFANSSLIKKEALLGALITIFLFFSALSHGYRNVQYTRNFAIICFLLAVLVEFGDYQSLTQKISIIQIFSTHIWYAALFFLLYFIISFLRELCPSLFADTMKKIFTGILLFEEIALFCIPMKYVFFINQFSFIMGLAVIIISTTIVAIGIFKHNQTAWPNMLSLIFAFIIFLHDVVFAANVIDPSKSIYLYVIYLILINQMMVQVKKIRLYHERKSLAELSFLQAQIKPHFLHNVINTVISISRYNVDQARELLYDFNNYLRNSFNMNNFRQLVQLKQEIDLVQDYVKIIKARFEERLDFELELPDNLEYLVPPLIIQPIIENAINHGVLPKPEGGKVYLRITEKNKKLIFHVKDNGIGMNPKQINEIMFNQKEGSIGLSNIQSRLRMLYDEELTIKSMCGVGTEITWQIPLCKRKGYLRVESYYS